MPILTPSGAPLFTTTTTAQNIMDAVAQDVRETLDSSSGANNNQAILLDYVNRTSLELMRVSRWLFSLSPVKRFVTSLGVTDYWVGPVENNPPGTVDTKLDLNDLRTFKPGTVYDRSNFVPLLKVDESPLVAKAAFADSSARPGRPAQWRQSPDTPDILNIYPAPDNQTTYSPQPEPAALSYVAGGNLVDRVYWVTLTYVDSLGNESTAPRATKFFVPANNLLLVSPPQAPALTGATGIKYDRYNVYAKNMGTDRIDSVDASSTTQQGGTLGVAAYFTEPGSGLTTNGVNPPTTNSVEPVDGYVIEFRYYKQRVQIVDPTQVLQIPDDYKDVVIAGTTARTCAYLTRYKEAQTYYAMYREGITSIIRDLNLFPRGAEFIRPDAASVGGRLPAVEAIDLSVLQN